MAQNQDPESSQPQNVKRFLAWETHSRDSIDVKRVYIDIAGDLAAGVLLSQLIYWHLPNKGGDLKSRYRRNGSFWLVRSFKDYWDDCRLTPKAARVAVNRLKDKGLIEVVKMSSPFHSGAITSHIRINWEGLLKALDDAEGMTAEVIESKLAAETPDAESVFESLSDNPTLQKVRAKPPNESGASHARDDVESPIKNPDGAKALTQKGKPLNPKGQTPLPPRANRIKDSSKDSSKEIDLIKRGVNDAEDSAKATNTKPKPPPSNKKPNGKTERGYIVKALLDVTGQIAEVEEATKLAAHLITIGGTAEEVANNYAVGGWWFTSHWLGRDKGEPPTLAAIKQTFGQWDKKAEIKDAERRKYETALDDFPNFN